MIAYRVARAKYLRGLAAAERGDVDGVLAQFHPECELVFAGDSPLGADRLRGPDMRRWFERFGRLLPNPSFEVQRLAVSGPPWKMQLAAYVVIRATVAGEPYVNQFGHFLSLRWGRVVEDIVVEDTQRWARACATLLAAGVEEAGAPPLGR